MESRSAGFSNPMLLPWWSRTFVPFIWLLHPASKWIRSAIWSCKLTWPLFPGCQSHGSLVPEQKGIWPSLDSKASALQSLPHHRSNAMPSCYMMPWALVWTWSCFVMFLKGSSISLIILFLRGLGFCIWRPDCSPVSVKVLHVTHGLCFSEFLQSIPLK